MRKLCAVFAVLLLLTSCGSSHAETEAAAPDWAIPPQYAYASCFSDGVAVVRTAGGAYRFIDASGSQLFGRDFYEAVLKNDGVGLFVQNLPTVRETPGGAAWRMQADGSPAPEPSYPIVSQDGLNRPYHIAQSDNGLWGLVDGRGQWLVEPRFDELRVLGRDQIRLRKGAQVGFMNGLGEPVFVDGAGTIEAFCHGYALVYLLPSPGMPELSEHSWYNFIDTDGNYVLDRPLAEYPAGVSENAVTYCEDGLYGFMDLDGTALIAPAYVDAGVFSEGLAYVQNADGKIGYIDRDGTVVIPFQRGIYGGEFQNGVAFFTDTNEKSGLMDTSGTLLASAKYDSAVYDEGSNTWALERGDVTDIYFPDQKLLAAGFSLVTEQLPTSVIGARRFRERLTVADVSGGKVVWHDFDNYFSDPSEGLLLVRDNGAFGYVDLSGSWVLAPQFEDAKPFSDGKAAVCLDGKWGYIRRP